MKTEQEFIDTRKWWVGQQYRGDLTEQQLWDISLAAAEVLLKYYEYRQQKEASRESRLLSDVPSDWKKYPDERPKKRDRYRVISKEYVNGKWEFFEIHAVYSHIEDDFYYEGRKIENPIAWMKIPEYKP